MFPRSFWYKYWDFFTVVLSFPDLQQDNRAESYNYEQILWSWISFPLKLRNRYKLAEILICKWTSWKADSEVHECYWDAGKYCCFIFCYDPKLSVSSTRLIVGVFFSGYFSGWKSIRNTTMININIGLYTAPPLQFEVKGKLEWRIKPLICYLHLIWSLVSKVELKG